jgi:threonine dehydratase
MKAVSHSIADVGKVLAGVQVPPKDRDAFEMFLQRLGYQYIEETDNEVYRQYLRR